MHLKVKRLRDDAILPTRATEGSVGYDLYWDGSYDDFNSLAAVYIPPGGRAVLGTGLAIAVPTGYCGEIRSRSGLAAKQGVFVLNSPGTIDSDYTGELRVILYNSSPGMIQIKWKDRIAQLVIVPVWTPELEEVTEFEATTRGCNGFGSTGR